MASIFVFSSFFFGSEHTLLCHLLNVLLSGLCRIRPRSESLGKGQAGKQTEASPLNGSARVICLVPSHLQQRVHGAGPCWVRYDSTDKFYRQVWLELILSSEMFLPPFPCVLPTVAVISPTIFRILPTNWEENGPLMCGEWGLVSPSPTVPSQVLHAGQDCTSEVPSTRWDMDKWYSADMTIPGKSHARRYAHPYPHCDSRLDSECWALTYVDHRNVWRGKLHTHLS